jgi:hypothetical protein
VSQKIQELKIYIYQISQYTRPQNSHKGQLLTTEPLTWVHTQHKPLKQVKTPVAICDPATAHFTAIKNLGNTRIAYKPRHTHTHTHPETLEAKEKNPGGN